MTNKINQPAREGNIEAITSFFKSGAKDAAGDVGIELEHTVVNDDLSPVGFRGRHGVEWLLEQIDADDPPRYVPQAFGDSGGLLGLLGPQMTITLEPAAQVEISAGPFARLAEAEEFLGGFEALLARILEPEGMRALSIGYHPHARAEELELIPKRRYEVMDRYFAQISPYGAYMMRGTASTQVSVDYTSELDCLRKMRLAFVLGPIFALICDNAPVFEGRPRTCHMVRTKIWCHCDPDRCTTVPGIMKEGFTLRDYARFILDMPAIVPSADSTATQPETRSFGELFADDVMGQRDVEHALSMAFTDTRLKKYVEIRSADAMPVPHVIAYAALVKGLFSAESSLAALEDVFGNVSEDDIGQAEDSLMENGYDGIAYGRPVAEIADEIVGIAADGLCKGEASYLTPLAGLAAKRTTLADLSSEGLTRGL